MIGKIVGEFIVNMNTPEHPKYTPSFLTEEGGHFVVCGGLIQKVSQKRFARALENMENGAITHKEHWEG